MPAFVIGYYNNLSEQKIKLLPELFYFSFMEILQIIFLAIAVILTVLNLFIFIGLSRKRKHSQKNNKEILFSIIIAAKNEADNLAKLMNALKRIEYSYLNYEIIIVDDNSSDDTLKIAANYESDFPNYKVYTLKEKSLPGKKGALDFGVSKAKYPYIMITDADCEPQNNWLKSYAEKFNEGYDFLFGAAPFYERNKLVNKISCFENLRSSLLTFSSANIGVPFSAAARNFGFKKSSFEKISGYKNTIETISGDDDLLLREAIKNKMKVGTVKEKNSSVYSYTKLSFKSYFNQRARHTKTSFFYSPSRQIGLGIWHTVNLLCLCSLILAVISPVFFIPFLLKLFFDLALVVVYQETFGYHFKPVSIFFLQIIYEIFLLINFAGAIFKKDKW